MYITSILPRIHGLIHSVPFLFFFFNFFYFSRINPFGGELSSRCYYQVNSKHPGSFCHYLPPPGTTPSVHMSNQGQHKTTEVSHLCLMFKHHKRKYNLLVTLRRKKDIFTLTKQMFFVSNPEIIKDFMYSIVCLCAYLIIC